MSLDVQDVSMVAIMMADERVAGGTEPAADRADQAAGHHVLRLDVSWRPSI